MDTNKSFQDMLLDLRSQFNQRIPGGLTTDADERLNKTLTHYVKEVERVNPSGGPQDILRMTYDSMAKWFKRNLTQPVENFAPANRYDTEMDPAEVFASIKAARDQPASEAPAPFRMPDLQKVEDKRTLIPVPFGIQQKDVLQPHEDTVKYREVEYNLVMNSKDRDWLNNTTQNRYNFVIQFNTNYKPQGYGLQAHINTRLRNIIRLEFIKAILPVEGLSVVVPKDCSGGDSVTAVAHPQNAFYSVLALPSVNVLVDEFQGNNYGTNNNIDKSLAVCQYDATWRSEAVWNKPGVNRGYSLFFPKFMKAQRVYSPTPLSNLQTLSFRLQDPEGNLLSKIPDSSVLATMAFSNTLDASSNSCYTDPSGEYIFLRTQEWFSLWSYSQLDKILLEGLTFISANVPDGSAALNQWLQNPAGQSVVGIAYSTDPTNLAIVSDGPNSVGYANWIIIRNRFKDPAIDGATGLDYFSGSGSDDAQLGADMIGYPQTGGILNLSRQVQLSIRIITREYDLVSNVRADNV